MRTAALAMLITFVLAGGARAQGEGPALYPHEEMNNWGKWGASDQRGAVNYITAEAVVAAAKLIQTGKRFSLAIPLDATGPVFPGRLNPHHTMTISGADFAADPTLTPFGPTPIRFADDYLYMPLQGSTQWDALSHAWYGDQLYNGVPQTAIRSAPMGGGATKLGIEHVRDGFVGRGVLVDVVRYKGGSLPTGYSITRADIEATLEKQGTEVRPGDMVLVRTGLVPAWYELKTPEERTRFWNQPHTGLTSDVVPWINEQQIAAIAADNIALERYPSEVDAQVVVPLHGNLLRDLGVFIGEIWWLEDLALDCENDGRFEFFLAAQPLNVTGAVGSPLNPIAIK